MRILVCIKQVPGTTQVDIDEKTGVLFAQYGNNDLPNVIGGAWVHFGRYHNDLKPLIPGAVAGKRAPKALGAYTRQTA